MKRLIFVLLSVSVVVSFLVVSVFATDTPVTWNYNDYMTNVQVDGENDLVTFDIPFDASFISVYNNELEYENSSRTGELVGTWPAPLYNYSMVINPIDFAMPLSTLNIPNGTTITIKTRIDFYDDTNVDFAWSPISVHAYYLGVDHQVISSFTYSETFDSAEFLTLEIPVNKVKGASSMAIVYDFPQVRVFNDNRYDYWIEIMTMSCQMSISSAYRMYEEANQENNKLLHEISKQLQNQGMTLDQVLEQNKSNGDKLDQIIEGTVVPSAPVGSDKVEDLGELEDGLMDSAQDGLDQADTIFNSAPGIVALYATGFLFMSSVIEHVASAGWISGIITVSLALGLLGFIANIAVAVVRGRSGGSGKGGKT